MTRSILLCLSCLLALPASASLLAKDQITRESIISGGQKRWYYLFAPEGLNKSSNAPLIITLHGSGRDGQILVEKWKDLAVKEGVIIAGPDALNRSSWFVPRDGPNFLRDVVEELKAKYSINPRRVYLFGHSAGGSFALSISMFESQYFAATAVSAGAIEKSAYWVLDKAKRKIPIKLFAGTREQSSFLDQIRATRDGLNERGFASQLVEIQGHDHNYYARSDEINRYVWAFFKQQELSTDPEYEEHLFKQ